MYSNIKVHKSLLAWDSVLKSLEFSNVTDHSLYGSFAPEYIAALSAYHYNQKFRSFIQPAAEPMETFTTDSAQELSLPLDLSGKGFAELNSAEFGARSGSCGPTSPASMCSTSSFTESIDDTPLDLSLKTSSVVPIHGEPTTNFLKQNTNFLFNLGLHRVATTQDVLEKAQHVPETLQASLSESSTSTSQSQPILSRVNATDPLFRYQVAKVFSRKPFQPSTHRGSTTKNRLQCKLCTSSFTSQLSYNKHMTIHRTKVYSCHVCGRSYKQARDYRAHVAAHKNGSIFQCDICSCVLSNSSDYLEHLKTHKQKDLHFCSHCKKYFRDACTLETHIRTHTGLKPYKCEECGKEFRQSGTYHRHKKLHSLL